MKIIEKDVKDGVMFVLDLGNEFVPIDLILESSQTKQWRLSSPVSDFAPVDFNQKGVRPSKLTIGTLTFSVKVKAQENNNKYTITFLKKKKKKKKKKDNKS